MVAALAILAGGCRGCDRVERITETAARVTEGAPVVEGPTDPADRAFARARSVHVPLGSTPIGEPSRVQPEAGTIHWSSMQLVPPVCYAFLAISPDERVRVRIRVVADEGLELAADRDEGTAAIPSLCPAAPVDATVEVASDPPGTELTFGSFALPQSDAEAARRIGDIAAQRLPGARAIGPVQAGYLRERNGESRALAILPGQCLGVVAVASGGITDLDLILEDARGEPLMRDLAVDAEPVITGFCADRGQSLRLVIEPYLGNGQAWWQVFELAAP